MKLDYTLDEFYYYCNLVINPLIHTTSNNCEITKKHPRYNGYGNLHSDYFIQLCENAKIRKKQFSITIEYIWNLFLKQNGYCAITRSSS